jgi:hypothetical protein
MGASPPRPAVTGGCYTSTRFGASSPIRRSMYQYVWGESTFIAMGILNIAR